MFSLSPPPTFPGVQLLTPSYNTDSKSTETLHSTVQPLMYEGHDASVKGNNYKSNKTNCCYLDRVLRSAKNDDNGDGDTMHII